MIGVADAGDASAVELGVKFRADVDGFVTGIRYYKSAANTGTHIGNLWTSERHEARDRDVLERDGDGLAARACSARRSP